MSESASDHTLSWPARIRRARLEAGASLREAAELIAVSRSTIRDWERGVYRAHPAACELLVQRLAGIVGERAFRERLEQELARLRTGGIRIAATPGAAPASGDHARVRLLRVALECCEPRPSLRDVATWTGFSVPTLTSWLRPPTNRAHRRMPRHALRLVLWELSARDRSGTDWSALLRVA